MFSSHYNYEPIWYGCAGGFLVVIHLRAFYWFF